jgi:hypothetical protein
MAPSCGFGQPDGVVPFTVQMRNSETRSKAPTGPTTGGHLNLRAQ